MYITVKGGTFHLGGKTGPMEGSFRRQRANSPGLDSSNGLRNRRLLKDHLSNLLGKPSC